MCYIIKYSNFILWPFQQHYFLITSRSLILDPEIGTGTYNTHRGCSASCMRDPTRLSALRVQILMTLALLYKKCLTKQRRKIQWRHAFLMVIWNRTLFQTANIEQLTENKNERSKQACVISIMWLFPYQNTVFSRCVDFRRAILHRRTDSDTGMPLICDGLISSMTYTFQSHLQLLLW